ncbi:recombination-associated protein RdgC, partial [Xenorhabdus bovienii]
FAQRFDADFVLLSGELSRMFDSLINALGGEAQ